jgi:hypothetical protein
MNKEIKPTENQTITVSPIEAFWMFIIRKNAKTPILEFKRQIKIGKLTVKFSWRSKKNAWGRFGGGWNWKAGFSAGGNTIYLHLLVADLMVAWK